VPSQQLQGQLQTQHSAVIGNYIMDKHNIKSRVNYRSTLMQKNKQRLQGMIVTNTEHYQSKKKYIL
jgi:hypothetical protein